MAGRRTISVALTIAVAAAAGAPASALAASASGSYRIERPATYGAAAHALWNLGGPLLAARAEARAVGVAVLPDLVDTDSRYVSATLAEAERAPVVTDCGDGTGHTTTIADSGVASVTSAFEADLVLDLLRGRGTAQVNVAETPYAGAVGTYFAPGLVNWSYSSACYDPPDVRTDQVPVLGGSGEPLFSDFIGQAAARIAWPLTRTRSGAWRLSGTRTVTDGFERDPVVASVTFTGSAVSMHALCTMPTVRDLRGARTLGQARAIARRAGFDHVAGASARRTRAARRGHWFVDEGIGNANPIACGSRGLHLVRSLGWS